jgi:hypothetical protein
LVGVLVAVTVTVAVKVAIVTHSPPPHTAGEPY